MSINQINNYGQLNWKEKKKVSKVKIDFDDNSLVISNTNQIKTSLLSNSFKIVDNNNRILMHFSDEEIVSFDLIDNSIYIYSADKIPYVLKFQSNNEAEIGNERINNILNGAYYI